MGDAVRLAGSERLTSAVTHAYSAVIAPGASVLTTVVAPLDEGGTIVAAGDVVGQVRQALRNLAAVLDEQGGALGDVARLTVYVAEHLQVDLQVAADTVAEAFDEVPPLAVVGVARLRYDDQVVEIEAVAAVRAGD